MAIIYPRLMQATKENTTFLQVISVESDELPDGLQGISVDHWYIEENFIPLELEVVS